MINCRDYDLCDLAEATTTHAKHKALAEKIVKPYQQLPPQLERDITFALDQAHADGDKFGYDRSVQQAKQEDDKDAYNSGYDRGVRESMEIIVESGYPREGVLCTTILSLLQPPVPVWEHKPDCPTPYQRGTACWIWRNPEVGGYDRIIQDGDTRVLCCPGCGAPKPKE